MKIDLNNPHCPDWVKHSVAACGLRYHLQEMKAAIPEEAQKFLDKYERPNKLSGCDGYDWEDQILKRSDEMSTELLERWVNCMPGGMFRAELRAVLKERPDYIKK